jgi:outer membrane protein assembly factor BamB
MPAASRLTVEQTTTFRNPIRLLLGQISERLHTERSQHRRTSIFASVISVALLFTIIGATAFVAINNGGGGDPQPTASSALAPIKTAEPSAAQASPPAFDDADWTYIPEGTVQRVGSMAFGNGAVYRLIETDLFSGIESVDALTGDAGWQHESSWDGKGLAADEYGVYFVSGGTELISLSPDDGSQQWAVTLPAAAVSFTLQDGVLYVWDESATMTAIRSSDGAPVWQKVTGDPGGPQSSTPDATRPEVVPVVAADDAGDVLAMVSANGNINLFSKDNGSIRWSLRGFDPINTRMSIMLDDVLFVLSQRVPGDSTSQLRGYGINVNSGEIDWEIDIDGGITQPSVYADDGGMVYVIGDDATSPGPDTFSEVAPKVDYDTGRNPWTADVALQQESGNGIGGMRIYGINAFTGTVKWIADSKVGPWVALVRGCPNSCGLSGVTSDGYVAAITRGNGGVDGIPITFGTPVLEVLSGGQAADGSNYGKVASFPDGTIIGFGYVPVSEMG